MKSFVDQDACIACGLCVSTCEDVYHFNEEGKAEAVEGIISAEYEADDTAGADRQPDFKGNPGKSWLPDRRRTGLSFPFQSDGNTFRR